MKKYEITDIAHPDNPNLHRIRAVTDLTEDVLAGEEMPAEVVKSRFLKLGAEHIQYVLDCLKDNPPRIRNIKQYLLAALYNAPLTIENYYAAQIDHDLCGGKR